VVLRSTTAAGIVSRPSYIAEMTHVLPFVVLALLIARGAGEPDASRQDDRCAVAEVVDGDTFRCGDGRKVRLIGVDTPEKAQGEVGRLARQALLRYLPLGRVIRLERDVQATDRYGRVLAFVWTGATLVNEAMVREGWAVLYTVPPDVKYAERFRRAQKEARARRAGLWASDGFECLPRDYRRHRCLTRS
jgi:micrococcal nuclease